MTDRTKSRSGRDGAQMRIRVPQVLRELARESAASERRHMKFEIVALIERGMKAKGPAAIAVAPSHGSTNPQKDTEMNEVTNTTAERVAPDVMDLEGPIADASRMASILSKLLTESIGGQRSTDNSYHLTKTQREDIMFAAYHTEDLIRRIFTKVEEMA